MNDQHDLQVKKLLKEITKFPTYSRMFVDVHPLKGKPAQLLSDTYALADKPIKAKMIAFNLVGRCRFVDTVVCYALFHYVYNLMLPAAPPYFSNWAGLMEECPLPKFQLPDKKIYDTLCEVIAKFVIEPINFLNGWSLDELYFYVNNCIHLYLDSLVLIGKYKLKLGGELALVIIDCHNASGYYEKKLLRKRLDIASVLRKERKRDKSPVRK